MSAGGPYDPQGGGGPGAGMNLYPHFAGPAAQIPVQPLGQMSPFGAAPLQGQCPHCNGFGGVVADASLYKVCSLCGGPRIPMPPNVTPSPATMQALRKAEAARKSRGYARGLAVLGGLGAVGGAGIAFLTSLFASLGATLAVGAVFAVPFVALLFWMLARAKSKDAELPRHLDEAWSTAAADVMRAGYGSSPQELAQVFGVDMLRAEQLHAMASVDGALADPGDGRVRVNVPPDPRFEALERKLRVATPEDQAMREAEAEVEAALQNRNKQGA
ncbi:MAG: hypothetical protein U0414_20995 [Polyangiaceae bacterium]